MALSFKVDFPSGALAEAEKALHRFAQRRMLDVTDRAATRAKNAIRQDMAAAGLGRLGFALGSTSDKAKSGRVYREGDITRASGVIYIRSKSERTVGAIISYTEGANILPVKGRWLWYPTEQIQRLVGKQPNRTRLTPALWRSSGLEAKFGPLIRLKSVNGNPVLAVRNVGLAPGSAGRPARIRPTTKRGAARKGDVLRELVVVFIGIPRTSRQARVNPRRRAEEAMRQAAAELRGV